MARLPQPGGDNGSWGNILNDFLAQSHQPDGKLKDGIVTEATLDASTQSKLNGGSGKVDKATLTTKGDMYVASGTSTPARLGVGNDGSVLTADSNSALGVSWSTAAIRMPKKYFVDDYGADPTGVQWSDAAVSAARAAMGNDPGLIVFGVGTYKIQTAGLNTENGMALGLYQGVVGQGKAVSRIDYRGIGACIEIRNLNWEFNTASEPSGGVHGLYLYGWGNTNANSYGIRYGDIGGMSISDVHVAGFNQVGSAGLYGDNWIAWSERADIEIVVEQCTTCFLFEGRPDNPASLPGHTSSFDYSRYRLVFVAVANQDAFVLRSRVSDTLTGGSASMNGVKLELIGNCVTGTGSNTGALFRIGSDDDDSAKLTGEIHISAETSGSSGGIAHYDFIQGSGSGTPGWGIKSSINAIGAINLIPISGVNFRKGVSSAENFFFSGMLKNSPTLGSTGQRNQFQSLQVVNQAVGRYGSNATNAVQVVYVTGATAGTFRLAYNGIYTSALPYDVSVSALQAALEAIPALSGNVIVVSAQARYINGFYADEYGLGVTFINGLSATPVSTFTVDTASLTGTVDVVVRNTGSPNITWTLDVETGNLFKIVPPAGIYRLGLNTGYLTQVAYYTLYDDSQFGIATLDVWIQQPTTGGNVVLEAPYFAPSAQSGSTYSFQWIDGLEPVLSTAPNAWDVIRLSTVNFSQWIGQHLTRQAIVPVPSTITSPGIKGQVAYDANYMYICVDTNSWMRSPIGSW